MIEGATTKKKPANEIVEKQKNADDADFYD
jgi:hypothetical protein